jgi:hypothetical protein
MDDKYYVALRYVGVKGIQLKNLSNELQLLLTHKQDILDEEEE